MKVLAWIEPGTWRAVVEEVRRRPASDVLTLLAVVDDSEGLPRGLMGGLMGRGHSQRQQDRFEGLSREAAEDLIARASHELGRDAETTVVTGRTERVVTEACDRADLLVLARDGDRSRLGPHSLGRHTRFILDHAPCTVMLLWPDSPPGLESIPPPPER